MPAIPKQIASRTTLPPAEDNDGLLPVFVAKSVPTSSTQPTPLLEVFQVYPPVLSPSGLVVQTIDDEGLSNTTVITQTAADANCDVSLMEYSFGFSYGQPFVVTSRGRQFDRLALMYFGDTEIWRTSTAEPTTTGIEWTYVKDMSEYLYLWREPQKLIFDLGNLIDSTYTGHYNTTLTATFFTSDDTVQPASIIIPISARNSASNGASVFKIPEDNATNTVSLPRNIHRAVFTLSACGQAAEEFWWSNVLSSDTDSFVPIDGILYGYSPWREVQLYIDGHLAGVQWPFPVIFTGGVVPGLWRPIVGIDTFDLREHEIDITPWLPLLCDGKEHTFEIKVAGLDDDGSTTGKLTETVGSSWYVTGKIFLWLDDDSSSITTGTSPTMLAPAPSILLSQSLTQNGTGTNQSLAYNTQVHRSLSISSTVVSQNNSSVATWSQTLSYTNNGLYTSFGAVQVNNLVTTGLDIAGGVVDYRSAYSYPLWANSSYLSFPDGNFSLAAELVQGLNLQVAGASVFPTGVQPFSGLVRDPSLHSNTAFDGAYLSTILNGTAHYFSSPSSNTGYSFGSTGQTFEFGGLLGADTSVELYTRQVAVVNATVVYDKEVLAGTVLGEYVGMGTIPGPKAGQEAAQSPKEAIGRGPGEPRVLYVQERDGKRS
ncbi:MAG: hypothetical protein M1818_006302 [Claussenomyces sp. TS43310]|nr:MAG: hypothetical protein M1818_006302 [Claussenomyces sp. TS43310]